MRLINCDKVNQHDIRLDPGIVLDVLASFEAADVPKYAILSHTWEKTPQGESAEVTFQEFKRNESTPRNFQGWEKIRHACQQAQLLKLDYIWIDSCCIDQANVAELSEAINSMYQWYSDATVCLVYLSDWEGLGLGHCRWFTRGWALQELVAPCYVRFYNSRWSYIGSKDHTNREQLAQITGIDQQILGATSPAQIRDRLSRTPICQRMSWASMRETTKVEDVAYCLLGIFDIQMPLLYGEGETAFIRLQQRIAETTNDLTLFAWKLQKGMAVKHNPRNIMRSDPISEKCGPGPLEAVPSEPHDYHGILACSPREFALGGRIRSSRDRIYNPEFSITNKGIRIRASIIGNGPLGLEFLALNCMEQAESFGMSEKFVGISLKWVGGDIYVRAHIDDLPVLTDKRTSQSQDEIYLALSVNHLYHTIGTLQRNAIRIPDLNSMYPGMIEKKVSPGYMWDRAKRLFVTYGHAFPFGCASYQVPCHADVTFMVFFGLDYHGSPFFCLADPFSKFLPLEYERRREFLARVEGIAKLYQTQSITFTLQQNNLWTTFTIQGYFREGRQDGEPIHDLMLMGTTKCETMGFGNPAPGLSAWSHNQPSYQQVYTMGNGYAPDILPYRGYIAHAPPVSQATTFGYRRS
ncbi:hypothetical protein O1611_g5969 [Lasiodiplodia mahajangana]|uniref:Uncharacterized protein n=1 Tax=Lasiodiplodia mahajangana TaxID=1108764 RepID=A0ACC2JJL4_9PEZI|nr:hypothetical protein O1611_g5969 [Lasiodiplodia mahajangana]